MVLCYIVHLCKPSLSRLFTPTIGIAIRMEKDFELLRFSQNVPDDRKTIAIYLYKSLVMSSVKIGEVNDMGLERHSKQRRE